MVEPIYHKYHKDNLSRDTLLQNENFLADTRQFLIERENYQAEELDDDNYVYDQFMEHFRFQNVNEVTAIKDLLHAQSSDQEGRDRMARLMSTYDKMDSELGMKALGDYAAGIFSAPSTYAGLFSFGSAKAGSLAAQQGIKWSIKEALKQGALTTGVRSAAIDATVAGGTVLAQEETRVETGQKDSIDMKNVGLASVMGGGASFLLGTGTGTLGYKQGFDSENILKVNQENLRTRSEQVYKVKTSKLFKSNTKKADLAKEFEKILIDSVKERAAQGEKLSLMETIPEELTTGKKLFSERLLEKGEGIPLTFDEKVIQNIASAAAEMDYLVPIFDDAARGSSERFTSRLVRGLKTDPSGTLKEKLSQVLVDHNINWEDIGPLFAAELSRSGSILGFAGRLSRSQKYKQNLDALNLVDDELASIGNVTSQARQTLEKLNLPTGHFARTRLNIRDFLGKARVGLMTVQLATTVRNTTNGFMRNYVYALDNLGSGVINYGKGQTVKYARLATNADDKLIEQAQAAVDLGKAQMANGSTSLIMKDMLFGMESTGNRALFKVLGDPSFGYNQEVSKLLRQMADVGDLADAESGILKGVRWLNGLNTLSDNMFKRAIFGREMRAAVKANPIDVDGVKYDNLDTLLKDGFGKRIRAEDIAKASYEAIDFTYQTGGYRGVEGGFNVLADGFIKLFSTTIGSAFVPFPKFMVGSFKFMYEHAPIIGMVNLGGIRNRPKAVGGRQGIFQTENLDLDISAKSLGQQMSGLATLGALYQARVAFGDETTGPFVYKNESDGGTFDARAMLGPFAIYALAADFIYRKFPEFHTEAGPMGVTLPNLSEERTSFDPVSDVKPVLSTRSLVEAFTGSFGRAGTGLYIVDALLAAAQNTDNDADFERMAAKMLGNYFNTYTVGVGTINDFISGVDPKYRTLYNNDDVEFLPYFFKQMTRSVNPTMMAVTDTLGVGLPDNAYFNRDIQGVPTKSGSTVRHSPFFKQLTGLTPRGARNTVQKETDRLQFDYIELLPKRIKGDALMTNETVKLMGDYVERELSSFIDSKYYKAIPSNIEKRVRLKREIALLKNMARNRILDPSRADSYGREDALRHFKAIFMNKPSEVRQVLVEQYRQVTGDGNLYEDQAWTFEGNM